MVKKLNFNGMDVGLVLYMLFAVIFFIIPIPSFALDFLLTINISIAVVILSLIHI